MNRGEKWVEINREVAQKKCYVVKIDPQQPERIFAGGRKCGLWLSRDKGATWRQIGLPDTTICDLAIDPNNPKRLFVLAPKGIYRTQDYSTNRWDWVFDYPAFQQKFRGEATDTRFWRYSRFQKIAINPHQPQTIIAGARWEGGYHRSDDGGDTWQHHWISGIFRRVDPVVFHPDDKDIVFVGTHHQGMFKSWNGGQSWVSMSRGLGPQIRTPYYGAFLLSGLVVDPSNPDILYSGSDYDNWKTTDGGLSWKTLGKTLTCEFARAFAVDPDQPNIVYAGTNDGIYKSTDAGATWRSVNHGLPELPVRKKYQFEIAGKPFEFALTAQGPVLFRRQLTDTTWLNVSWCLPDTADFLEYDANRDELVLHVADSVFRSPDAGLRWYPDKVAYTPITSAVETAPFTGNRNDPSLWTLEVEITGNVFFDDEYVLPFYKRPPFVSLQLVTPNYPLDRSVPLWSANWERYLKGTLQIPRQILENRDYLLYLEVRDFQRNTLIGYQRIHPQKDRQVQIQVDEKMLLPCFVSEKKRK